MIVCVGIDPGLEGAIAVLAGPMVRVWDVPTLEVVVSKRRSRATGKIATKKRQRYNLVEMARIVKRIRAYAQTNDCHVVTWIEDVHAMPEQGVASMFSMGRGLGSWEGIVAACGLSLEHVAPRTWKHKMMSGMGKEKEASVYKAQELWPQAELVTPRGRRLHGRADALLIAEYGRRTADPF